MSIIEEFERNLQFEQQYISSVVEGMDEMHIICPICRMWVQEMAAITHDAAKVSPKLQTCGDLRLRAYVTSSVCQARFAQGFNVVYNHRASCVFRRNNLSINSHFVSCTCGLYINTKVRLVNSIFVWNEGHIRALFLRLLKEKSYTTHIHPAYE